MIGWLGSPWRISSAEDHPVVQDLLQENSCAKWVCLLSVSLCKWLGGTLTESKDVLWVYWLWGLSGGTGQGQPLPVFCSGLQSMSYKVICRWLLLVLGLEVPRRGQGVNQGWLPLVWGLGPLSKRYGTQRPDATCLRDFRKVWSMNQDRPFIWKSSWKQLGWALNLDGAVSQGITMVWPTVWDKMIESQIWPCLLSLWGKSQKRNNYICQLIGLG